MKIVAQVSVQSSQKSPFRANSIVVSLSQCEDGILWLKGEPKMNSRMPKGVSQTHKIKVGENIDMKDFSVSIDDLNRLVDTVVHDNALIKSNKAIKIIK